jgi:CheY-like chemotaxis protein
MRALRLRGDVLPGIAVSGYGHAADVESTRAAGFLAHLVKPVHPDRLLETLEANTAPCSP